MSNEEPTTLDHVVRALDLDAVIQQHVPGAPNVGESVPSCQGCARLSETNYADPSQAKVRPVWPCLTVLLAVRAAKAEQALDRIVAASSVLTLPPGADIQPTEAFASIETVENAQVGDTVTSTEPRFEWDPDVDGCPICGRVVGRSGPLDALVRTCDNCEWSEATHTNDGSRRE